MTRMRRLSLVGLRFGKLLVIEKRGKGKNGLPLYECLCDCGTVKYLQSNALNIKRGTKSCGCLRKNGKTRLKYRESSFRNLFAQYKDKAVRRNLCFELNIRQFKDLTLSNCFYCGVHPQQIHKGSGSGRHYGDYIYNGIDRKDNTKGYKVSNCVTCCGRCNRAKDVMTQQEFFEWVIHVYENHCLL